MPQRAHRLLIPLAALLAVIPILIHGPSCGHDFDFHLLSWLEASNQFAHFGIPHWAYTPAWNAGEPRFIFYPPLSWTLGGLLGLILPWTLVPAAFTWICLTLSGLTAHRLARGYANPNAALLAATLYLANPYMLFTAYERTAYGELLAAAFLPLLFEAALATEIHVLPIAIPIALLWLTNAPAAVMACYALAFLTLVRLALGAPSFRLHRKAGVSAEGRPLLRLTLTTTAGVLLGLTLAAFYILPAAYERKFVQTDMAVTTGMRPADHYLFHRMSLNTPGFTPTDIAFHDAVVRTASLVALTLLAAIALAFAFILARSKSVPHSSRPHRDEWVATPNLPLLTLTLLIAFLLTPPSAFLWRILPQLHFLQFPWRLCALLAVILCILTAQALGAPSFRLHRKGGVSSEARPSLLTVSFLLILAAALVFPAWHLFHQPCDEEDNIAARVALFHSNLGTDPTDEYTPANADPDALAQPPHTDPPYWLIPQCGNETHIGNTYYACRLPGNINQGPPPSAQPGQAPDHLSLNLPSSQFLVLNRRAYPTWRITVNGRTFALPSQQPKGVPDVLAPLIPDPLPERQDGLIAVPLSPGTDNVDLVYHRTHDQTIGLTLSALAALTTLALARKKLKA